MESGRFGTLTIMGIVVLIVFSVILTMQKDNVERFLLDNKETIASVEEETQGISRKVDDLKRLESRLVEIEGKLDGVEENARRLERLAGQVETLADVRVVQAPAYYPPAGSRAQAPPVRPPAAGEEGAPTFSEAEPGGSPGEEAAAGGEEDAGASGTGTPGWLAAHRTWKETLVGRKLKPEEIDRLWAPGPDGVIRPVAPRDATWRKASREGGEIHRRLTTDPKGFNPLTENSADVSEIYSYCTSSLCRRRLDDPDVWEYDLAVSAEISNDYKTYTFRIRPGVHWRVECLDPSDPITSWVHQADREVTSRDFKFYVDMVLNPQVQAEHARLYYKEIDSVEVVDRYTFRIHWKKKTYNSLSVSLGLAPLPYFIYARDEYGDAFPEETLGKSFNEHWFNNMICGCGPYDFVEWRESQAVVMEANPEYYGPRPYIQKIRFNIIRDDEAAFLLLQSPGKENRIDFGHITRTQYKKHYREKKEEGALPLFSEAGTGERSSKDLEMSYYTRLGYNYIGWNLEDPLFTDKRVRQAMTHAFPRQLVLDTIFEGLGDVVSGNFYLHGPDYNHDIQPLAFDLDASRALLAEAGWADMDGNGVVEKKIAGETREFRFKMLIYANSDAVQNMCNLFKEQLRKVGVILDVLPLDWALMQQKMQNREFAAYTGGWALAWESDPYQIWHSEMADTPKSSNFVSFRNEECDRSSRPPARPSIPRSGTRSSTASTKSSTRNSPTRSCSAQNPSPCGGTT